MLPSTPMRGSSGAQTGFASGLSFLSVRPWEVQEVGRRASYSPGSLTCSRGGAPALAMAWYELPVFLWAERHPAWRKVRP